MLRVLSRWGCAIASVLACAACIDDRTPSVLEPVGGAASNASSPVGGAPESAANGLGSGGNAGALAATAASSAQAAGFAPNTGTAGAGAPNPSPGSGAGAPAQPQGLLTASVVAFDFGAHEAGVDGVTFSWVITNAGTVPTGSLSLASVVANQFQAKSTCPVSLPPGGTCTIDVTFAPTSWGSFASNVQFGQDGQLLTLAVTGIGRYLLTVRRSGQGELSEPSGTLVCGSDACSGLFDPGTVMLSARTENGSGSIFTGWSEPECGTSDDCSLTLSASTLLTATFQPLSNNLIFVTSSTYPTNFGGLAVLDAECNRVASAAGINGAAGNDFIAGAADSTHSLRQRLGTARGWVRRDNLSVGDTLAQIFDQYQILYSPGLTEHGVLSQNLILTGTDQTGASDPENCNDWTSLDPSQTFRAGNPGGSPRSWLWFTSPTCGSLPVSLYCIGISRSAPIGTGRATGKRMWLTLDSYTPGRMTPDAFCQSERPAGVSQAVAFIAYTDRPAAAVLDPSAVYVRTDGAQVGTGSEIAAMKILAGPWLTSDGTVDGASGSVWGGAPTPNDLADPAYNCQDWTIGDSSANGQVGDIDVSSERFFYTYAYGSCADAREVRCVEP
jgi:hypothetical protein